MRFQASIELTRLRQLFRPVAALALFACAACTWLLNRDTTQCHTDADCLQYGVQPSCQNGACVDTGTPCFLGTPQANSDFLNACTVSSRSSFDDCARLGVCVADGGPPLVTPPAANDAGSGASDAGSAASDAGSTAPPMRSLPNCSDLPSGPRGSGTVYVTGSSNFPTLLARVAPILASGVPAIGMAPAPAVVYLTTSSCTGADAVFGPSGGSYMLRDPPAGASLSQYAQYYKPDGTAQPCSLGPTGTPVDVGEADIYSTTCNSAYVTISATDTPGPIQAMAFVVPSLSDQLSISAEAAREVFGTGGNGGRVAPWTNPDRYYVRNKNTGTQQMIGRAIGVPPGQFWGIDRHTAQNLHDSLQALTSDPVEAEQAIGIIAVDVYDSSRNNLRALAYKAPGQTSAFLPDSTATSYDKQNVRDGHYPIWGPLHFFTPNQASPQALAFLTYFNGATLAGPLLDAFIQASLIPLCAMKVDRAQDQELGAIRSFAPTHSCECYFLKGAQRPESPPTPLPAECKTCTTQSDCPPSRVCSTHGFCETQ